MKTVILFLVATLLFVLTPVSQAKVEKKSRLVTMKCYVELYGGSHTIFYEMINQSSALTLINRLKNRAIYVIAKKEKQKIFQAKECVKKTEQFASSQAQALENKLPK